MRAHTATRIGPWSEPIILAGFVAALAPILIPSHWTSIWMDREFTGTVAAIANRLEPGVRLYADGAHIPMPPLPFVAVRLLTNGHATWLWESSLNFAFQALTLLLMYMTLRRIFRPPVPFLATLVAVPIFFAIHKSVLYDPMAQAAVALLTLQTTAYLLRSRLPRDDVRGPGWLGAARQWLPLAGLGVTSAVALLTKQSTGVGACLGVAAAIAGCDRGGWRDRTVRAAAYGLLTVASLAILITLLHPWVDPHGLIRDVFLTGAEPKGGAVNLMRSLKRFGLDIGRHALTLLVPLGGLLAIAAMVCRRPDGAPHPAPRTVAGLTPAFVAAGAGVSVAAMFELYTAAPWLSGAVLEHTSLLPQLSWMGLFLAALLSLRCRWPHLLRRVSRLPRARAFAGVLSVTFAAAVFHSLSSYYFRWTYDNNPLVVTAYAALFQVVLVVLGRMPRRRLRLALIAAVCFAVVPLRPWARLGDQLLACRRCTQRWDEVGHLAGARLPESAGGMRELVRLVRGAVGPGQQVLLLPNDPNVEAWFERDRPRLSSPFVFADQYWDRYVDADFEALRARPPQVIVIGPARYWRGFHRQFKVNAGAERLIDRVLHELLAQRYEPAMAVPILHEGKADAMEVFVRRR